MADHADDSKHQSFIEKIEDEIEEKFHGSSSSSDSDSDSEKKKNSEKTNTSKDESSVKNKIWRLFGREKPVHHVFGGGKPADVFLWRNKKISAAVLGGATAVYVLFELLEYHLLSLVCHILILSLAILFLYSKAATFITKSPPHIPEVVIPEKIVTDIVVSTRYEINKALFHLREIASGKDLKKFLIVVAGLWVLSIVGSYCNFLTLTYIVFVLLHTVPVLYEKYEDKVDMYAEKATAEIKKYYAVINKKYLSKIPRAPLKDKKLH